ncbi:MAG: hypothetical protein RIE16_11925 [Rhodospirillales bacterium]
MVAGVGGDDELFRQYGLEISGMILSGQDLTVQERIRVRIEKTLTLNAVPGFGKEPDADAIGLHIL